MSGSSCVVFINSTEHEYSCSLRARKTATAAVPYLLVVHDACSVPVRGLYRYDICGACSSAVNSVPANHQGTNVLRTLYGTGMYSLPGTCPSVL